MQSIQAGIAAADMTPEPGPPLQGHAGSGGSHSIFAPLEARAVVFECDGTRVGIVTLDSLGISAESTARVRQRVQQACDIRPDHLMIACSHTHCAPAMVRVLDEMPYEPFLRMAEEAAVRCSVEAGSSLRSVRFGLGCGSVHFNINRRPLPGTTEMAPNELELVDRRVRVLTVTGEDDDLIAVLFHYSCHPTTMSGTNGIISPDYPGVARARIESKLGCKAMFLPGCAGDIRPNIQDDRGQFASATQEQLRACGLELGDEVSRVAGSVSAESSASLRAQCAPLVLRYGRTKDQAELQAIVDRHASGQNEPLGPWARRVLDLIDQNRLPESRTFEMQHLQIGPLAIVGIPGEPVQSIGHAIERRCRAMENAADCWPVGYSNDALGYFCTSLQHKAGGYEPNAYVYDNEPAPYEDEANSIISTATKLLENNQ